MKDLLSNQKTFLLRIRNTNLLLKGVPNPCVVKTYSNDECIQYSLLSRVDCCLMPEMFVKAPNGDVKLSNPSSYMQIFVGDLLPFCILVTCPLLPLPR